MKTHNIIFSSRSATLGTDILFYGGRDMFFSPYSDYWRQLRKLCTMELLTVKRVLSFRSIGAKEVSNAVAQISRSIASGKVVDLKQLLLVLTTTMISRAALGKAPKLMTEKFVEVAEEMVGSLGGFRLSDLFLAIINGFRSKLLKLHEEVDLVLDEIINDHIANTFSDDKTDDLVDVLLKLKKSNDLGFSLTMEALKGVLLVRITYTLVESMGSSVIYSDMFLGGTDMTTLVIEWTMSEIMKNPCIMQRVQKLVRGIFRDNVDEVKLQELEYLNVVIKETLRLHPPAPIFIPPETFDPERFLNSTIDYKGTHFGYIPFGAGRRMFPGLNFGMVVVQFVLASMLFHFYWKLPGGVKVEDFDMREVYDALLWKKEKLYLFPTAPMRLR
ncbi:unnamed protein product [Linum tenue]|uniref:Cytochrome P450 n=1 Tax=Linum tenue TaxID=586396 RepID=A0AAV0MD83_9ROSI|nr:unnamed protein product [Linum tenue]